MLLDMQRREFLKASAMAGTAAGVLGTTAFTAAALGTTPPSRNLFVPYSPLKAKRLKPGDSVGLVAPASAIYQDVEVDVARESLEGLGLKVKVGQHLRDKHGYLAGDDKDRADDINRFFKDDTLAGVIAIRGGWGSARLLPYVDFDAIRRNPKVFMGYSDITALHNAIQAKTGLITFHGPIGLGRWDAWSVDYVKRVLFNAEAVTMSNKKDLSERNVFTQVDNRTRTITPGKARGKMMGGNLTVLTSILGSPYVPDYSGSILFLEDVQENLYRIDRMLTSLKLAGILDKAKGVVFGMCSQCSPGNDNYSALTLEEILEDHVKGLGVPAWQGAMIGHDTPQWTVPFGLEVEIDAAAATVTMSEAAVS
jgi:muramoyltetrapeptide carboxypeptidase